MHTYLLSHDGHAWIERLEAANGQAGAARDKLKELPTLFGGHTAEHLQEEFHRAAVRRALEYISMKW